MSWVYRRPPDFRAKPSSLFLLLYAASAITGSSSTAFANTGTITGEGALAGTASLSFSTSATWSGADVLEGTVSLVFSHSAPLQGTGALAGSASQVFANSGTASFSTAYNIAAFKQKKTRWRETPWDYSANNRLVIFRLSPETAISGQCDVSFSGTSGTLVGSAAVFGVVPLTTTATGALLGSGALAGSSALAFTVEGDATGTASGSVAGVAASTFTPTATLDGIGNLGGSASSVFAVSLIKGSIAQISGTADFAVSASGALIAFAGSLATPRRRAYVIHRGHR